MYLKGLTKETRIPFVNADYTIGQEQSCFRADSDMYPTSCIFPSMGIQHFLEVENTINRCSSTWRNPQKGS